MAKVVFSKDWSKTQLGPLDRWPQSLRTTVSLCLASNFPISIAWGPERVQIYNDGYWPICGAKHPHSMGQDFKECWFSAWPVIGEAFERAQRGETSYLENQRMFLDRNGYLEETFFTFSFSPIREESGAVGGLFHPVTETTANMLNDRRTRALCDLAAQTAQAKTVEDAYAAIINVLSDCVLDLPFGLLYVFDSGMERATLAGCFGLEAGTPASPTVLPFTDAAERGTWPMHVAVSAGKRLLVEDLHDRFGVLSCGPYPEFLQKAVVLPVPALGLTRWAGVFIAGVSTRLPADDAYCSFYDLLASHVGTAIANARAYDEERKKAEALAELDRAKTTFFSNVSHEFRTPLTLMLAPLEDLLANDSISHTATAGELARVHRNGLRLLKLVNTLLDFARIEAGRVEAVYEPTDLSGLTADLASAFRSAVERGGLQLVVDCPPLGEPLYVDREMWEKIVLNLISNAFKFTFEGFIAVRLHLTETHAVLVVEDTGTGIAAADLPRVFERFHRIEGARSRTHEGTGIGLALIQELTRLHGGSISLTSEPGHGSVFTVEIPRGKDHLAVDRIQAHRSLSSTAMGAQPHVDEALRWLPGALGQPEGAHSPAAARSTVERPESLPRGAAGGTILFADDNADMRDYLRRVLSDHYEVHAVVDGEEALAFARRTPVDLVLTDVMMPRMDGFELLRQLRADPATEAIPIILLSARAGEESRVEGLAAGADDYLVKPFTVRELLARVDTHLRLAHIRKDAAALHESELRFRSMADCAPLMVWTCDVVGRCDYFNRGWLLYTGRTPDEELAADWTGNLFSEDRPAFIQQFETAAAGRDSFDVEFRLRRHDGRYLWMFGSGAPRFLPGGEFRGYIFCCVNVDDRRRAQQELEESQERLQLALAAGNEGLWDWDALTGGCFFGPRYLSILGYESGDLPPLYETWIGLLHPEDRDTALEQRMHQIVHRGGAFTTEYRLRKKTGEYTWIQSKGKVTAWTPDGTPARIVGTITDITERKRLEEQFYQSERLDSVGRLAGGIAHDFNNLLTVINGYADMLAADLADIEIAAEGLTEIRAAGDRAAGLTQQLLAFSRKQLLQLSVVNLNDIVTEVSNMLRRLIGEDIQLVTRLAADLGNVVADQVQMQQILMNLAVNSRDAMPNGGALILETSNTYLDESYIGHYPDVRPGHHVLLAVTDTGAGMTPEVRERIFEPFFTTKPKGQGTGLGLATVYGIVKQSGGWIWVYSEPGRGTTFKLYFRQTDQRAAQSQRAARTDLRGTETILVVEDQEEVRTLATKALQRYGYTVFTACGAGEALDLCKEHPRAIDLVITDVVMPGLSGRELGDELIRMRPDVRILFMSGYTDDAIAHRGVLHEGVNYIQKPFTPEILAAKVRDVLDAKPAR
jgi:PAS domain S-box-containing protein